MTSNSEFADMLASIRQEEREVREIVERTPWPFKFVFLAYLAWLEMCEKFCENG